METTQEKQVIPLTSTSKDWYYTMKEHDTTVVDKVLSGKCTLTGICRSKVGIGDSFIINRIEYTIESIEFRNSKGIFNDPKDAIDSFFTAETSFSRLINL